MSYDDIKQEEQQEQVEPNVTENSNSGSIEQEPELTINNILNMPDELFLNNDYNNLTQATETSQTPVEQPAETQKEDQNSSEPTSETTEPVEETVVNTTPIGTDQDTITPEEFMAKVTQPFMANGRKITVNNADKVVQLMQMGANYNKKLEKLKPHMGILRTLEHYNISSEELQFLLDLKAGRKEAIAKVIQDHQIDTYNLPDVEEKPYSGEAQVFTNTQAELESIVRDLQTDPMGNELIQDLTRADLWDKESLDCFSNEPQALNVLLEHKQSGLYDTTMDIIVKDKLLNNIPPEWLSRPLIQLYNYVATNVIEQINAQNQVQQPIQQSNPVQHTPRVVGNNLQQEQIQRNSIAPKNASIRTGGVPPKQNTLSSNDILNLPDSSFEEVKHFMSGLHFN